MNSLHHLYNHHDRAIPSAELAAVRPLDRPAAATVSVRVKALKPAGTIQAMAATMAEIYRQRSEVTTDDLLRAGFTAGDVAQHGDAARHVAAVNLGMQTRRA